MKKNHRLRNLLIAIPMLAIIIVFIVTAIYGIIKGQPKLQYTFNQSSKVNTVAYPNVKFAVISDLHYYENALGTSGTAFENVLKSDRKLLKDSADLLNLAIDNIIKSKVQFLLVSGDLTKDGELVCHQDVAKSLSRLTQSGIKVYVVPGNHDVNNPLSYKYEGDKSSKVPDITASQFADIYKDCGYSNAIYRDTNSLSYVAEPVNNLWIVALDTCRYAENKPGEEEIVSGKLSQEEENWLTNILKKANENNKAVIILGHHGLVEHWEGQSKLHPDYLLQDYKYVGKLLASYGVRLAFTGHYHAQDIALASFDNGGSLYDVETGSLITAPCAVRYCALDGNKIEINSDFLVDKLHPNTNFAKDANQFVFNTVEAEAYKTLRKYYVSEKDAKTIADYVSAGFVEHYKGDENIKDRPAFDVNKLSLWSRIIYSQEKYVVNGLWKDSPSEDNNVTLNLN